MLIERLLDAELTVLAIHPKQVAATRSPRIAGGSVALGSVSAGMLTRRSCRVDAAAARRRASPAPHDESAIARSDVVDEHIHLRRRPWDVRVDIEVGDALLGQHVLT